MSRMQGALYATVRKRDGEWRFEVPRTGNPMDPWAAGPADGMRDGLLRAQAEIDKVFLGRKARAETAGIQLKDCAQCGDPSFHSRETLPDKRVRVTDRCESCNFRHVTTASPGS
jgi:hypothetical protein